MKKLLGLGLVLVANVISAPLAQAGSPSVVGKWEVTFFLEPTRVTGATQCIEVNSVPGTVAGVPTSGTWVATTFPDWSGQWIQLGDHVRWFGVTESLATAESGDMENSDIFTGVSFNHFAKTNGTTSSAGSWIAVRVSECPQGNESYTPNSDPSGVQSSAQSSAQSSVQSDVQSSVQSDVQRDEQSDVQRD